MALNVWALYTYVTQPRYVGANDFYQRWQGAEAFWVEGRNPYSTAVSRQVELFLYGAPASTDPALDQYPGDFLYPFPTAILIAPLTVLPYDLASAIWMVLTGAAVALAFVLLADLFNWRPSSWLMMFGIVWAVTLYPAARGLFLGQPGVIVVCLEIVALWALAKQHDTLAGVVLAVSTYKPQLGILLIPFLVLWAIRFGRWRFLVSAGVTLAILLGLSFVLLPSWLGDWIAQASQYNGYTRIGSPVWVITQVYLPFLGRPGELVIDAALVLLMLWAWFGVLWKRDLTLYNWTIALTVTVTHLISVRTATPHFVVLLFVFAFYLRELNRSGTLPVIIVMIAVTVFHWWLFLATVTNHIESPAVYLPLPFGALILLLTTQQRWRQTQPATARPEPVSGSVSLPS